MAAFPVPPTPDKVERSIGLHRCPWLARYDWHQPWLSARAYRVAKRVLDLALTIILAPLWVLVVVVAVIAIKVCSPRAPVYFVQTRSGAGGRPFRLYKLRTMVPNAEALKDDVAHLNELSYPDFKIKNDPRRTRLGRILRATSIDELPQLFNVLKGDMSLVGPRPTYIEPDNHRLWQTERLEALPGITGLWQLVGRGSVDFADRSRLDIAYVQRQRLTLDVEILLRSIPVVLTKRGH